jgi:hypothetical protein
MQYWYYLKAVKFRQGTRKEGIIEETNEVREGENKKNVPFNSRGARTYHFSFCWIRYAMTINKYFCYQKPV